MTKFDPSLFYVGNPGRRGPFIEIYMADKVEHARHRGAMRGSVLKAADRLKQFTSKVIVPNQQDTAQGIISPVTFLLVGFFPSKSFFLILTSSFY